MEKPSHQCRSETGGEGVLVTVNSEIFAGLLFREFSISELLAGS